MPKAHLLAPPIQSVPVLAASLARLSYSQIATRCNISKSFTCYLLTGRRATSAKIMRRMSLSLGCTLDALDSFLDSKQKEWKVKGKRGLRKRRDSVKLGRPRGEGSRVNKVLTGGEGVG